jgi:hypothetical protein
MNYRQHRWLSFEEAFTRGKPDLSMDFAPIVARIEALAKRFRVCHSR